MYSKNEELGRLVDAQFTPAFVFLDGSGKKVLEVRGFRTPREAKALHEFVNKRHYARTSWPEFLKSYPQ
jgi:thioredoxin-related protein